MARKRRKLDRDLESNIAKAIKNVELITAKIYDIYDDGIREEYQSSFLRVRQSIVFLSSLYDTEGATEQTYKAYEAYQNFLTTFVDEYEI